MTRDFSDDANIVGFDGTEVRGRNDFRDHAARIFADHKVASFVTVIRDVREIAPGVAILHANAGMLPPGKSEVNPAVNTVQTLVAVHRDGRWQIELFQNTPAAWHGREDDVNALTAELQSAVTG
jgi:uncharacterized protein (TIGR02246 family)